MMKTLQNKFKKSKKMILKTIIKTFSNFHLEMAKDLSRKIWKFHQNSTLSTPNQKDLIFHKLNPAG